jgi:shikimate dehydrogenase
MIRACCIGWPIKHARSPLIHRYWLREYGIEGDYVGEGVEPARFADFFRRLADHGYVGCNITLPHKEEAFSLLDEVDPAAVAVGAVNTVWIEDGRLVGMNTDVPGFLANLDDHVPNWDQETRHALVLGAGGAARGIVHGLLSRGVEIITVANRTRGKAKALAAASGANVHAASLGEAPALLPEVDLLVNTTALGMAGQPELDFPLEGLKSSAVVTDVVYVPLETDLLVRAAARGHRIVGGLGMLLHQAVPGFERWFGVTPKVTAALHDLVAADVRGPTT